MKNVFVPVDFSACSDYALKYAMELCKTQMAQLFAVHGFSANEEVISSDFVTPFQGVAGTLSSEQITDFISERKDLIDKQLAEIVEWGKKNDVEIITHCIDSSMFEDLAQKAEELNCDLVVMGSNGSKGIEEALIGSNTQKFVRNSSIPVMVIKNEPVQLKRIAFFSTFTKEGERKVYHDFKKLFDLSNIKTDLVYVNTPSNFLNTPDAQERIASFTNDIGNNDFETHIYNELSVEEGVIGFAEQNDIDMVVLATHGYTGFKRFFHHSYTESIINHINKPVLSFELTLDK